MSDQASNTIYPMKISSSRTLYVRTDGNDSNDGSSNDADNAFATLTGAVSFLNKRWINEDSIVEVCVVSGHYENVASVNLSHPNSQQIKFTGSGDFDINVTGVNGTPSYATSGYNVELNVSSTSNILTGDYIGISKNTSSGTYHHSLRGIHKIVDIDTQNDRITIELHQPYTSNVATGSMTYSNCRVYKTILNFADEGLVFKQGLYEIPKSLVLVGTGSENDHYGLKVCNIGPKEKLDGIHVGIAKFEYGMCFENANLDKESDTSRLYISNCYNGVVCDQNSSIELPKNHCTISGCYKGILCNRKSYVKIRGNIIGCSKGIIANNNSYVYAGTPFFDEYNDTDYNPSSNAIGNRRSYIEVPASPPRAQPAQPFF